MTHARSRIQAPFREFTALIFALILVLIGVLALPAAAAAYHPDRSQMAEVQAVAHELEDAARRVHRLAERSEHHYDRGERRALSALHELEESADHFHRQVERHRQNPFHTEADYRRLERAYWEAYRSFHGLHGYRHVEQSFHRVQSLMDDLNYFYTAPRGHGRGRYDRHDDRNYRGHGEYRGDGRYRGHGQYRGQGRYRGSRYSHSGSHYEGCGH